MVEMTGSEQTVQRVSWLFIMYQKVRIVPDIFLFLHFDVFIAKIAIFEEIV